jgi:site-specific DNA recombinase
MTGLDSESLPAAIYCRISRDAHGLGLGVARQEELCRKLASEKGWRVAGVYVDNDMSAYSGAPRPSYERLLSDLESGLVEAVVVVDQDRLTRHPRELEEFILLADRLGTALANVSGEVNLGSPDGRFRARIMGAVARQESEKKSERLKRQRDQQARLGLSTGGRRRFGYKHARTENGQATWAVVDEEADRVREAAERFLSGDSLRQIAIDFNRRRVSTVTGAPWRVTTLRTLLTGAQVAGLRVHRGEIIGEASWDAILDRTTWEQVRAVLGNPRRAQRGRPPQYLLTGVLVCGRCGSTLYSSRRKNGSRRYMCNRGAAEGPCGRIAVVAEPVERAVSDQLLVALGGPTLWRALDGADSLGNQAVVRELAADEASLEELARDHYVERAISRREFLASRSLLEERIAMNRIALQRTANVHSLSGLPRTREELEEVWKNLDVERQRAILTAVVDEVVVNPGTPGRRSFDPSRLEIRWRA